MSPAQEVEQEMNKHDLDALIALEFRPMSIADLSVEVWEPILICFHTTQRLRNKGLIREDEQRVWELTVEGRQELEKALPIGKVPVVRLPGAQA